MAPRYRDCCTLLMGFIISIALTLSLYWNNIGPLSSNRSHHAAHTSDETCTKQSTSVDPNSRQYNGRKGSLSKPNDITVSGLVFYGRKDRTLCMICYLERNLADNGGWLDEVLWIINTDDQSDLEYLDEILSRYPTRFKSLRIPGGNLWSNTYYKAWQQLERGKYYVKIDDDIVWMDDEAIPLLVSRKVQHPRDFVVSANVINNPPLGFLHYHFGAIHPYFPEVTEPSHVPSSWQPSRDPYWNGPGDFSWPLEKAPPFQNHRWLRVKDDRMLASTPAAGLKYAVWGDSYSSWAIAAQMHYSLLENIESHALDLYKFGRSWNMDGERIRINFICVYADDILDTDIEAWPKDKGDEDMIVMELPKQLQRPVMVVGESLAAHFQYLDQPQLSSTDLLQRYQELSRLHNCSIL